MTKKILTLVFVAAMVLTMPLSVSAHGCKGNGQRSRQQQLHYELCNVESCEDTGRHQHDDDWYCGRSCGGACHRT